MLAQAHERARCVFDVFVDFFSVLVRSLAAKGTDFLLRAIQDSLCVHQDLILARLFGGFADRVEFGDGIRQAVARSFLEQLRLRINVEKPLTRKSLER